MNITRRNFLKGFLGGALGVVGLPTVLGTPLVYLRRARASSLPALKEHEAAEQGWAFIVDSAKCIGCGLCVRACKEENNVVMEPEYCRTWVERYVFTAEDEVFVDSPEGGIEGFAKAPVNVKYEGVHIQKSFFVPKLCNQCNNPPCVQVCPVGATYKTEEGVVLVDQDHCIGCRYCIQACPYGARYLDPRTKVADKCTWCYHRTTKGLKPACVEVCPAKARLFGDSLDPGSEVQAVLHNNPVSVLKPSLGTRPKVYYLGIDSEVR